MTTRYAIYVKHEAPTAPQFICATETEWQAEDIGTLVGRHRWPGYVIFIVDTATDKQISRRMYNGANVRTFQV